MSGEPKAKSATPREPDPALHGAEAFLKMFNYVRKGVPPTVAAAAARVPKAEVERSMSDPAFAVVVAGSEAVHEAFLLEVITNAAQHDWHAAAFLLERRYPGRWGREQVERRGRAEASEVRVRVAVKEQSPDPAHNLAEAEQPQTAAEDHVAEGKK
jgi:hypothetical protein